MEENYCLSSSAPGVPGRSEQHQGCHPSWEFTPVGCQVPASCIWMLQALSTPHKGCSHSPCSLASATGCSRHSISNTVIWAVLSITASHSPIVCFLWKKKRTHTVKKEWKSFLDVTLLNKPLPSEST